MFDEFNHGRHEPAKANATCREGAHKSYFMRGYYAVAARPTYTINQADKEPGGDGIEK
jgi:hypothetical protein